MKLEEATQHLINEIKSKEVIFPESWDEETIYQNCEFFLHLFKKEDDSYNIEEAANELAWMFGSHLSQDEIRELDKSKHTVRGRPKKSFKKSIEDHKEITSSSQDKDKAASEDETSLKHKKPKKTEIVVNEGNRPLANAIQEMAMKLFEHRDQRKGPAFALAAKDIRETPTLITNADQAKHLRGIGSGIGAYIEEFLDTGHIMKLEEYRAGIFE